MFRFNIVIAILSLLALRSSAATQLSLTANPDVVMDGLTNTLTLRCSLLDANNSEASERFRVSNTSFGIEQVNSFIVYRGKAKTKTPIARIIGSYPADALDDKENLQPEGVLSPNVSTGPNYLELVWTKPRKRQDGQYTCEAHMLDTLGRGIVLQAKADIKVEQPGIPELITEMINLENRIDFQGKTINDMIDAQEKTNNYMKTILKAPHTEQGEVLCSTYEGDSWRNVGDNHKEINKFVRFKKPYIDIPVVGAGIAKVDTDKGRNARYYFEVRDVSRTGFKITCGTWSNSITNRLAVRWTSTVA